MHDDEQTRTLTRGIARGDESAFAEFYGIWFDACVRKARAASGRDESFCLDVVQDALVRAARRMPPLPTRAALDRWLERSITRAALDRLRAEARRARREQRSARPELGHDPTVESLRQERIAWLRSRLGAIADDDRALLILRFQHGATLEIAGEQTGRSADAAHGRIRRAIETVRGSAGEVRDER